MTTPPPPNFVISYEAPPAAGRFRPGTLIAWVVILASVAALMVRPRWLEQGRGTPSVTTELPNIADTPSPQLQIISRCLIGAKSLAGDQDQGPAPLHQIDQVITNPIDEFRAIPVVAELAGRDEALRRLDAFEKKHPVVRLREDVDALWAIYTQGVDHLTARQAQRLVERHDWFGKVAISYGLPKDDPRRLEVMRPAGRTILILVLVAFIALVALVTGIVLAIFTLVLMARRRIVRAYQPAPTRVAGPFVEAFALYLAGMLIFSHLLGRVFPSMGLAVSFFLFSLLPVALVYLRLRGVGWGEMKRDLGLHRGRGFFCEVGIGLYGYLAGLPVLAIGVLITFFLMKLTGKSASHPIVNQPMERFSDILQVVLLACVAAPIIEETMFRGALLGHLRARLGWWISAPIVSLIFAAIHPQGWVAIPVLGAIAMVLAGLREWRGSLVASMTAHAVNNGVAVLVLVLMFH